ncbi:MAG: hypothetical protein M3186_05450 [Actinomycetota bacterium]|nr:hypothetical protein [Actinomycetota bacterium]
MNTLAARSHGIACQSSVLLRSLPKSFHRLCGLLGLDDGTGRVISPNPIGTGVSARSSSGRSRLSPTMIASASKERWKSSGGWFLRYCLSYRDVEELLVSVGINVDHVSVYRWVQRFAVIRRTQLCLLI